jgi:hypothetical protein
MTDPRTLRQAAFHVRLLRAVERAYFLGELKTVEEILNGVDPIECQELAKVLDRRAGEIEAEQFEAPAVEMKVTHAFDNWSRRV